MTLPLPQTGDTGWTDELNSAIEAKAEQAALDALSATVATKADASTVTAKADKTYVDTQLATKASTTTVAAKADKTYVDSELATKADLVNGTVPTSQLPSASPSSIGTASLVDRAVTPGKANLGQGLNVIANPGFESGAMAPHVPYPNRTTATLVSQGAPAPDGGTWALRVQVIATSAFAYFFTFNGPALNPASAMPVKPGDTVYGSFRTCAGGITGTPKVAAYLDFMDANGVRISNFGGAPVTIQTGIYETVEATTVVPDGAAYASLNAAVSNSAADDVVWLDNAQLYTNVPASALPQWVVSATEVNVEQYGVFPTNTAAENDAAIAALFADFPSGGVFAFPRLATYNFTANFPMTNNQHLRGVGYATKLILTNGLWKPPSGASCDGCKLTDLYVSSTGSGQSIMDFSAANAITNLDINRVHLDQVTATGHGIVDNSTSTSHSFFGLRIRNSKLYQQAVCTQPFISVSTPSVGVNDWLIDGCMTHQFLNPNTMLIFMDYHGTATFGYANLVFQNIVSEQPKNGWCNLQGVTAAALKNISIWDVNTYTASVFRFAKSGTGTLACFGVKVDNCGTASNGTNFTAPDALVRITDSGTASSHNVGFLYQGNTKVSAAYA